MHDTSHHIERLAAHLKGGEQVLFSDGQEAEALGTGTTRTLTTWFNLNQMQPDGQDPPARSLLYAQVPEHFTWQKQDRTWKRRQRQAAGGRVIGRLHTATPSEGPRFYLYLLLLDTPGAKSFEDLVTVARPGRRS